MLYCREDFTAFADVCFREFGEDVKLWTTINEATIFAFAFYGKDVRYGNCTTGNYCMETYIAGHNMLLAHASASNLYKLKYKVYIFISFSLLKLSTRMNLIHMTVQSKQRGSIGLSIFALGLTPYTNSKDDEIATQRAKAFLYGW